MLKHRAPSAAALALAFAVAGAGSALAAEASAPATIGVATLHWTQAPLAAQDPASVADDQKQSDAALADLSGRGDSNSVAVALTEQSLSAVNTGNTINANSLVSGAISLQDSALSGFGGIGNIMMNTGANNNLQSTMSVTIVITP